MSIISTSLLSANYRLQSLHGTPPDLRAFFGDEDSRCGITLIMTLGLFF